MIGISIIVPVYNTKVYLPRCLNSIINQTYRNIEIIIIDDCSPDDSYSLLQKYELDDDRIKLIKNNENIGLGAVRNLGIKIARGKYLLFVDSDDWIDLKTCELLFSIAETNQLDILEGKFVKYKGVEFVPKQKEDWGQISIFDGKQYLKYNDFVPNVWNKLWSKEFVIKNNIYCLEKRYFEDNYMSINGIARARKIAQTDFIFYYYNALNENSITSQVNDKLLHDRLYEIEYMEEMIDNYDTDSFIKYLKIILAEKIRPTLSYLRKYNGENIVLKESLLKKVSEILKKTKPIFIRLKSVPLIKRIIISFSPVTYVYIFRTFDKIKVKLFLPLH